jgi:hypothetical protein
MQATPSDQLELRAAMEARDLDRAVDAFASGAILRSPLTDGLAFEGRDQIRAITQVVLEKFENLRYVSELRTGDTAFLVSRARVGGADVEIVDYIRLNPDGRIRECTIFFRPLPAAAVALRVIGAGLGRRRSALRGRLISALARPLGFLAGTGDEIGVRLVRPTL